MSAAVQRPNAARSIAVKPPAVPHSPASQILPLHALHVDPNCEGSNQYEVYGENEKFSVLLTRRWTWENVTFIILQTLKALDSSHYGTYTRFGFVGEVGKTRLEKFDSAEEAVAQFCELFKAATGNRWAGDINKCLQADNYNEGKYILLSGGSADEMMTSGAVPFDVKHTAVRNSAATAAPKPKGKSAKASSTAKTTKTPSHAPTDMTISDSQAGTKQMEDGASPTELQEASKVDAMNLTASKTLGDISENSYLHEVDCMCPDRLQFEVVVSSSGDPYAVVLEKLDSEGDAAQQSAFMLVQLLRMKDVEGCVFCFSRWGWFHTEGDHVLQELESLEDAVAEFKRQFLEASGNEWHGSLSSTVKHFSSDANKFSLLDGFVWESMCNDLAKGMGSTMVPTPQINDSEAKLGNAAVDLTQSSRGVEEQETTPKTKTKPSKEKTGKDKTDKKEKVRSKSKKLASLEIDEGVEDKEGVTVTWSVKLAQKKGKRLYILQLLEKKAGDTVEHIVHVRVSKDGAAGGAVTKRFPNMKVAKAAFRKKFEEKTQNKWLKDYESTKTAFTAGEGDEVFVLVGE